MFSRHELFQQVKNMISTVLVFSSLIIMVVGLALDSNIADIGGVVPESVILILSLILLAFNEGFQVGVVSIQHISSEEIYEQGNFRASKISHLMFETNSDQLKKLFIGQSFMVVTCTFMIAQLTTFSDLSLEMFMNAMNLPSGRDNERQGIADTLFYIFAQSGLPGVIVTVTFAQLLPSIFAKQYPLQFLNIIGVYPTIRFALLIESIGILKFVFIIFNCLNYVTGRSRREAYDIQEASSVLTDDESINGERASSEIGENITIWNCKRVGCCKTFKTWMQVFLSSCLTIFSSFFVIFGIAHRYSTFGNQVHPSFQVLILFIILLIVFYCEGLKIAVVSTSHLDHVAIQAKGGSLTAIKIHQLLHPLHNIAENKSILRLAAVDGDTVIDASGSRDDYVKCFLLGR